MMEKWTRKAADQPKVQIFHQTVAHKLAVKVRSLQFALLYNDNLKVCAEVLESSILFSYL